MPMSYPQEDEKLPKNIFDENAVSSEEEDTPEDKNS
jgi:hypothetical protein